MGVYDRDYARPSGEPGRFRPGGGGGGPRQWSINRWIITICVAVFVLDQFLPATIAPLRSMAPGLPEGAVLDPVDRTALRLPSLAQLKDGSWPVFTAAPSGGSPTAKRPVPRSTAVR